MDSLTVLERAAPVMPVITIPLLCDALPLAEALLKGGISVFEITLRTECALHGIALIKKMFPECLVGAGTVINQTQFEQVVDAGSDFIISPGISEKMLAVSEKKNIPFIPGVSSASEIMMALEYGLNCLKFFPAESSGGVLTLKALSDPFQNVTFCPTGGINYLNMNSYLSLNNVICVGGSWLTSLQLIKDQNWQKITDLAKSLALLQA